MTDTFQQLQQVNDASWAKLLADGKEQCSNLEANRRFLDQLGWPFQGMRVLEIGCGIGTLVAMLHEAGTTADGIEIAAQAVAHGREKYPGVSLAVQQGNRLPYPDASIDRVLSFDVFEHIPDTDAHLAEVARVLRPGGEYLLQTPNQLSNAVYETLKTRSLRWRRYHPSLHRPGQLRRRFHRHGFSLRFHKVDVRGAFWERKLRGLGPLGRLLGRVDLRAWPLALQTHLFAQAVKQPSPPDPSTR